MDFEINYDADEGQQGKIKGMASAEAGGDHEWRGMRLWKCLSAGRRPAHGGSGRWPEVGEWLRVEGDLVLHKNGLHLCRDGDAVRWLSQEIYEAESRGEIVEGDDKIVVREARLTRRCDGWTERTAREFACDCAERVVHLCDDPRPREAIAVARRYARGDATDAELDAARAAARDAAGVAAWAAGETAGVAAWEAARAAAWYAAGETAREAAREAESKWQTDLLLLVLTAKDENEALARLAAERSARCSATAPRLRTRPSSRTSPPAWRSSS